MYIESKIPVLRLKHLVPYSAEWWSQCLRGIQIQNVYKGTLKKNVFSI